jgi:hypothetical protein
VSKEVALNKASWLRALINETEIKQKPQTNLVGRFTKNPLFGCHARQLHFRGTFTGKIIEPKSHHFLESVSNEAARSTTGPAVTFTKIVAGLKFYAEIQL